ncbi:MAG TPA: type VI secretion IcmF C-terminal domain-containing protein [Pseudomonadota bacterium]|nr:type VI secretion IcmF C-terminal domain-containing protein [Pseudomonadota bacterium]HNN92094.1 type VI secretion IcmF C-terminal domain-containing protein [Pseudomonadota bacterium]
MAASGSGLSGGQLIVLLLGIVLIFLVGLRLWQYLRERSAKPRVAQGRILADSLLAVWRTFLDRQPPAARALVSRYPWVVLMGESGAGKTALVDAKADCRSQQLNDFPSYTDDPLLKLHLGRRAVIHELGPELLSDNTIGAKLALSHLWKPLCRTRPPLAVIVLSLAQLHRATPTELRTSALRLASRLKLLSRLRGARILTRVCVTHLEILDEVSTAAQVRNATSQTPSGSESLAQLLFERRVPLVLDLDGLSVPKGPSEPPVSLLHPSEPQPLPSEPGPLATRFLHYAGQLKFALPTLPAGGFDQMVHAMATAPQALLPVETLLVELLRICEDTTPRSMAAIQLDKLYLVPQSQQLQRANPLVVAGVIPPRLSPALHFRGLRGLWLALRTSNVLSSWHAVLCLLLISVAALSFGSLYLNHRQTVQRLASDCARLVENIPRAKEASGRPGDSPVVWRNAHMAATSLQAVAEAERYWPLLPRTLRSEKNQARAQFVESVRRLYLEPVMENNRPLARDGAATLKLAIAKQSFVPEDHVGTETAITKMIYALGAWNASGSNALGDLIRKDPPTWASLLEIPEETLLRYVDVAPGCAIQANRKPPSTNQQDQLNSQSGWFAFIEHIKAAISTKVQPAAKPSTPTRRRHGHSQSRPTHSAMLGSSPPRTVLDSIDALKREAALLLSVLQATDRLLHVSLLRDIATGLAEECRENVSDLVGPLGTALRTERWLEQNKQGLSDIATLVLKSEVKPVDCSEPSAEDVLTQLSGLVAKVPTLVAPSKVYSVRLVSPRDLKEKTLSVSEREWEELLTNIRRQMLINCWHGGGSAKSKLAGSSRLGVPKAAHQHRHRHRPGAAAERLLAGISERDPSDRSGNPCGTPSSPVELIDPYNKTSFEQKEKPPRVSFDKVVTEAGLPPEEQARLAKSMLESTSSYGRAYRDKLRASFVAFGVRADSASALHAAVIEMMLADSGFQTHLRKIADNANLGDLSGPYLAPLAEQLAPFRPLLRMTTPNKDGVYQDLDGYRSLLAQLAGAIDSATTPEKGTELPLRESVTGIGRVALAMLAEEESSPLLATQRWLDKSGVMPELRGPFLAPMRRALCLGRSVVEDAVARRWVKVRDEQVKPLYSHFPFNRDAQEDVPIAALEVIHPKDGSLWRFVRDDLAPFVQIQPDGRVTPKRLPGGTVKLPPDMLPILNHLQTLGRRLWDAKEGTRKALELRVKPLLLQGNIGPYSVTRAFLSVGNAAAVGYNQMPAERPLPVTWWNQENASAGIDLATPNSAARLHSSIDETKSAWSMFRLLRRGTLSTDHIATFLIPVQLVDAKGSVTVKFVLSEDPFAMFQPPTVSGGR